MNSGMKRMTGSNVKKELASTDIVRIIKTCARHRVVTLKFGDLDLSFNPQVKTTRQRSTENVEPLSQRDPHVKPPVTEITEQEQRTIASESLRLDELALRKQQFSELLITDPAAAEQMLADGELDDVDDELGDDGE